MLKLRSHISHTTVIAYLSLFLALGGTGFAATQIAARDRTPRARAARAPSVKVRCTASVGHKKVTCKVVKGSGVGPPGPRGLPGNNGAAGPTTYTQPPGFSYLEQTPGVAASSSVSVNFGSLQHGDEYENFALFTNSGQDIPASAPGEPILQTYVDGPTEFDGSTAHFYTAGFCYGGQLSPSASTTEQLTHIALVEYVENNGPVPAGTSQPPPYTPVTLWSAPITNAVPATSTGAGGCLTVGPSSPVAIQPNGYLALWITPSYTAPNSDQTGAQITFGRVTTTFGP